jgi:hypothetical protein
MGDFDGLMVGKITHSEEHHVSRRWHGAPAGGLRARRLRKTAQGIMTTDGLGQTMARVGRFTRAPFWAIKNKHARRKIIPGNFPSRRVLI